MTWHDAWFDFDQAEPDDFRADYVVRTVGFLVREGPRFVSIAQEILPDGEGFRAVTHIPVSIVESVAALQTGPTAASSRRRRLSRILRPAQPRPSLARRRDVSMTAIWVEISAAASLRPA